MLLSDGSDARGDEGVDPWDGGGVFEPSNCWRYRDEGSCFRSGLSSRVSNPTTSRPKAAAKRSLRFLLEAAVVTPPCFRRAANF